LLDYVFDSHGFWQKEEYCNWGVTWIDYYCIMRSMADVFFTHLPLGMDSSNGILDIFGARKGKEDL
jgi:hypothetical protein